MNTETPILRISKIKPQEFIHNTTSSLNLSYQKNNPKNIKRKNNAKRTKETK